MMMGTLTPDVARSAAARSREPPNSKAGRRDIRRHTKQHNQLRRQSGVPAQYVHNMGRPQ